MTSGTYWNYQRDEINDDANENNANNIKTKKKKTIASKSFEYKTKIIIKRPENNSILDTEVAAPLKQMSSFWWLHD